VFTLQPAYNHITFSLKQRRFDTLFGHKHGSRRHGESLLKTTNGK
jgi:hypothetical protein